MNYGGDCLHLASLHLHSPASELPRVFDFPEFILSHFTPAALTDFPQVDDRMSSPSGNLRGQSGRVCAIERILQDKEDPRRFVYLVR